MFRRSNSSQRSGSMPTTTNTSTGAGQTPLRKSTWGFPGVNGGSTGRVKAVAKGLNESASVTSSPRKNSIGLPSVRGGNGSRPATPSSTKSGQSTVASKRSSEPVVASPITTAPASPTRPDPPVVQKMKKEMEDRITELSTQIVLVRAQVEEREAKLDVSSKEVDEVKDQLAQAMNELNQLRATNLQLSGSDDAKGKELLALKASHDRLRQLYNATSQALDLRTSDLEEERRRSESLGLASRLNDTTSSDDVVGLLQASNERIHAFASFMADQFDLSVSSQQGAADFTSTDMEEAKERAEEILGSRMVHLLMQSGQKRKAELVRLAFQAGICAYAEWMVSSWMFEDPGREGVLNTVYESMRKSEPSPLLGLWRSLTRKHGQKTTKVSSSDLSIYFLDALINVLIVSGFRATHMSLHSHITTAFPEQIALLVQDATKLNKSIGEEVVEYDLEVVHIPPETPFDPVYMEDASGKASGKGKKDRVLCTVELGLLRLVKNETNGKWENRVLVKPRVLLQSAI